MAIYPILKMGDARLLRVAQPVTAFDTDALHQLVQDLLDTMRAANGAAQSWRFAKTPTAGKVLFTSAANALPVAQAAGLTNIHVEKADDGTGTQRAVYRIDLGQ